MKFFQLFFLVPVAAAAGVSIAHADQLADVKSKGVLRAVSSLEPFAYQDTATREVVGNDVDRSEPRTNSSQIRKASAPSGSCRTCGLAKYRTQT
ncbi:exported protein of unknown function (plasmid) [Cupriavidus taiwanensis]|uniref:Uncharacterized protein n=1 Tax=Cupriavidus taiwanensis TaxID=164546 RepID=A0A7Z7NQL2_9BURK|nr:exported hypothetical protein [Cupriavidus taiwanensis]SOZ97305.1 exported hypothetical protein [Cupriavidus taiwanensis]SPC26193.1 exported hypothetical protein [Cupriavidus taiwanensis]SPD37672.1 exported protein of unknown function [Cupriavidus taiwanensis]